MVQNFTKIKRNKFFSSSIHENKFSPRQWRSNNFEFWEPRNLRTFSVCDDHVAISF